MVQYSDFFVIIICLSLPKWCCYHKRTILLWHTTSLYSRVFFCLSCPIGVISISKEATERLCSLASYTIWSIIQLYCTLYYHTFCLHGVLKSHVNRFYMFCLWLVFILILMLSPCRNIHWGLPPFYSTIRTMCAPGAKLFKMSPVFKLTDILALWLIIMIPSIL